MKDPPDSYLVVEGVINSSTIDSTLIKLTRTVKLTANRVTPSGATNRNPELNAEVYVEDGSGFSVKLIDIGYGNYTHTPLGLDLAKQYRLRIKTAANKTYLSDLVPVVPTPPIDSIGFDVKGAGVQVYVNTHDPKNNTRYYRWEYSEAWKFHAAMESKEMVVNDKIVERTPEQMLPKYCWGSSISTGINVNSSTKYPQDVIYQGPITFIAANSDRMMDRYSIEVKQFALTKEAYIYWEELKRNTESLGTIFDAQPSANISNIHCVENADEPVMGYISVTDIQRKRVFVNKYELNLTAAPESFANCKLDTQLLCRTNDYDCLLKCPIPRNFTLQACWINDVGFNLIPVGSLQTPVRAYYRAGFDPAVTPKDGYLSTKVPCIDCTTRGDAKPPPFWKDK